MIGVQLDRVWLTASNACAYARSFPMSILFSTKAYRTKLLEFLSPFQNYIINRHSFRKFLPIVWYLPLGRKYLRSSLLMIRKKRWNDRFASAFILILSKLSHETGEGDYFIIFELAASYYKLAIRAQGRNFSFFGRDRVDFRRNFKLMLKRCSQKNSKVAEIGVS